MVLQLKSFQDKTKDELIKELKVLKAQLAVLEELETARKRAEEEAELLKIIILSISGAKDLHSALGVALKRVCETTGWILGQAWVPSQDKKYLECSPEWYSKVPGLLEFRKQSEEFKFPPGIGLPGRVWSSKCPAWARDVTQDPNFPRAPVALKVGLKAGLAIPILSGDEAIAVIEFFMFEAREEDVRLVGLVTAVATQLGTVIEKIHAIDEYRNAQERFSGIFNSSKDAIGFCNLDRVIVDVNDSFSKLTGYSKEELIGKKYHEITPVEYHDSEAAVIKRILNTGEPEEYEKEYIRKEGSRVPILLTIFVVKGEHDSPVGIAAIIKDITEQKKKFL